MELLTAGSSITWLLGTIVFICGGVVVLVMTSPNNKLRLAAWLETSARAQIEIQAAKAGITKEARSFQRVREAALLQEHTNEPRQVDRQEYSEVVVSEEFTQRQLRRQ